MRKRPARNFLILAVLAFGFLAAPALSQEDNGPLIKYMVVPDPAAGTIDVQATVELQNRTLYLKDFGRMESIGWAAGGKEITVSSQRLNDILVFSGLPYMGQVTASYRIKAPAGYPPGTSLQDVHFLLSPALAFVREGLFLGMDGREGRPVDVRWRLPEGWTLGLGREGVQPFKDTQMVSWLAGKMKHVEARKFGNTSLQIAVLERPDEIDVPWLMSSIGSVFELAAERFGEPYFGDLGLALFPKGALPGSGCIGGTALVDVLGPVPAHEIIHLWKFNAPPWFGEGVLDYVSKRFMIRRGLMKEADLQVLLRANLAVYKSLAEKKGAPRSLADISAAFEHEPSKNEELYLVMPIFASKLDREIRKANPKTNLEDVFSAFCRRPIWPPIDVLTHIKQASGYDPKPLFDKYFFAPIKEPDVMAKWF